MKFNKQLVIIDALNLIRRIYAVLEPDSQVQTLISRILNAINKTCKHCKADYLALVWDGNDDQWRQELYPEYKLDRKPMPEKLASQLPHIQQLLADKGIYNLSTPYEADDAIATLALKAQQVGLQTTIISTDKGFYQLLEHGIKIWNYFAQQSIGEAAIKHDFNVEPQQLLEYWALAGSPGNKIKGVPGIGKKGAADLLNQFGCIKDIYNNLDALPPKAQDKLISGKQLAKISYLLVKLRTDLKLGVNLNSLRLLTC